MSAQETQPYVTSKVTDISSVPPHFVKNKFVLHGYVVHEGVLDAVFDALQPLTWPWGGSKGRKPVWHNEQWNTITGAVMFLTAIYTFSASFNAQISDHDAFCLRILSLFECFNAVCVVAYHSLLAIPSFYHAVSALDLLGISMLQIGVIAGHSIQGASSWSSSINHSVSSASCGGPGCLWGLLSASNAPLAHLAIVTVAGAVTCATRWRIQRESPPILIAANAIWYFILMPDYAIARFPAVEAISVFGLLIVGICLYGAKFPDRFWPGRFDVTPWTSHTIWHMAYVTAFIIYSSDVVGLAIAGGATAGAAGAAGSAQ